MSKRFIKTVVILIIGTMVISTLIMAVGFLS
ncbi:MAG TPA: stressosome-associated protein Prli42 [Bacillota bacterium]|nr:stressosome-associated protein Prli42 [Bacillota bacterium]